MPLGYGTAVVNGQMVNVAERAAYDPLVFGQAYTGPGMWQRQGVYNVPPVLPSPAMQASMAPGAFGATGTYPYPTAASEKGNPFHPTKSPLWMGIGGLAFALFFLHFIVYKKG
jgi:hypothetical protein